MRSITLLSSYPRSGNTFVRALLANYERDAPRPLTTQEVAAYQFGEHNEELLRLCSGLGAAERTIRDNWLARSAYFSAIRQTIGDGPAVVKTHTLNGTVFGLPSFDLQAADRVVYILRHPFDVAVSGAEFFGISQAEMAGRMVLAGATNQSGDAYWEVTGSWRQHVAGWLNETKVPILLVRYEALCSAPRHQLARILSFMGRPVDHRRLKRAVEHSAFDILQASQRTDGFNQGPSRDPRAVFFRKGRPGDWTSALAAEVAAGLSLELGELMDRLGYAHAPARARGLRRAAL